MYELQKLRCNLCDAIFTAKTPADVGSDKYDAESASMIALLKYGSGLGKSRIKMQKSKGQCKMKNGRGLEDGGSVLDPAGCKG